MANNHTSFTLPLLFVITRQLMDPWIQYLNEGLTSAQGAEMKRAVQLVVRQVNEDIAAEVSALNRGRGAETQVKVSFGCLLLLSARAAGTAEVSALKRRREATAQVKVRLGLLLFVHGAAERLALNKGREVEAQVKVRLGYVLFLLAPSARHVLLRCQRSTRAGKRQHKSR